MIRKLVSIILSFALLFSMSGNLLVAASETTTSGPASVEDILNKYYDEALGANYCLGRSSQSRTSDNYLEQKTINELNSAGYEAYILTSDNYTEITNLLNTNFNGLEIDPNLSYIITVSGEQTSNNRSGVNPEEDYFDDGTGSSCFYYTYGGITYKMRYLTFSPTSTSVTSQSKSKDMLEGSPFGSALLRLADVCISYGIQYITGTSYIGTVLSICGVSVSNIDSAKEAKLDFLATVNWTRSCIQIYNDAAKVWETASIVDYAAAHQMWDGRYFNKTILKFEAINQSKSNLYYSAHYSDYAWRKQQAATAYISHTVHTEYVGDIKVYSTPSQYFPETTTPPMWTFNCPYT